MRTRLSLGAILLWLLSGCDGGGAPGEGPGTDAQVTSDAAQTSDGGGEPDRDGHPSGGDASGASDTGGPTTDAAPATSDATPPSDCDLQVVMAKPENGCTRVGCHGAQFRANLDLVSPDLGARLLAQRSVSPTCSGRPLIDVDDPESSVLLRVIDPARASGPDGCGVSMPLGLPGVEPADLACFRAFVEETIAAAEPPPPPAVFEPATPEVYGAKVKTLLTGEALTADDLATLAGGPDALRGWVTALTEGPGFRTKMETFLRTALQQDSVGERRQGLGFPNAGFTVSPLLLANLEGSFVRTAMRLVDEGRPFTEILTTSSWEVTTALLVLLAYADQTPAELALTHRILRAPTPDLPMPLTAAYSVANRVWVIDTLPEDCRLREPDASNFLRAMFGRIRCRGMPDFRYPGLLTEADHADWRTVTFDVAEADAPVARFYDVESLRAARDRVALKVRRVGFFSTPVFLDNWVTNEDNQFRVTTNQTLVAALGATFSVADATPQASMAGLDPAHAAPGTECNGCHRLLDPMRLYFDANYDYTYRAPEPGALGAPAFAFRDHTFEGGRLPAFGRGLAEHPLFARAWVQKLCFYANSQACDPSDPELLRVAAVFAESGFDFKTLVVETMASPLVTAAAETQTHRTRPPLVSISRARHLCATLQARTGTDVCARRAGLLGLIPDDAFARGAPDPVLTAETSGFHSAAVERLCTGIAPTLVGAGRFLLPADPDGSTTRLVEGLMGLPPGHPRHDLALRELRQHVADVRAAGGNGAQALQSAFVVACRSPELMAIGF